ncbi:MAG TPA: hypothetical protein VGM67_06125 [Gemmatimonadaceae bacterium]|jgi:hypothetical protein
MPVAWYRWEGIRLVGIIVALGVTIGCLWPNVFEVVGRKVPWTPPTRRQRVALRVGWLVLVAAAVVWGLMLTD